MSQFNFVQKTAMSFPEATEEPHFEKTSFRVKKKIFATYDAKTNQVCLKLTIEDQDVYSLMGNGAITAVPNKWGQQGWTHVKLDLVENQIIVDALKAAYCLVAPKGLSKHVSKI